MYISLYPASSFLPGVPPDPGKLQGAATGPVWRTIPVLVRHIRRRGERRGTVDG